MKVFEALARAFAAEGTSAVFGMMGDANMYWINAVDRLGIGVYEVRHEGSGLAMADGWARVSGDVGVCTTTSGPGCAQLATTMLVASRARTPLVAFCGEVALGDDEAPQRLNQERLAEATEAGFVRLLNPEHAYRAVQRAFYRAKTESRPIMLSVPLDVQQMTFDDDEEYEPSERLIHPTLVHPDPVAVREAADIVTRSRRPVIIAGQGAMRAGAGPGIVRLADRVGALIATTLMTKNWLRDADFHAGLAGLYATRTATELYADADCVIAVGASMNKFTTAHGYLFPAAQFIHLDASPDRLMGAGLVADRYVQTDARLGVEALDAVLDERAVRSTGFHTADVKERLATALDDAATFEIEPGTVDPREVCRVLDDILPTETSLILDAGQQVCFAAMLFARERRFTLANQQFGCIGQGVTVGIGAVLAGGRRPAFLMEGDAGLMMHLAEFETAVRYDVPLLVVTMNDEMLGAEYHKSVAKGLNGELTRIGTPNLGAVGIALGGRGALVRSIGELRSAVAEFVASPAPTILDVRISRNVLSVQYRRVLYGQDV